MPVLAQRTASLLVAFEVPSTGRDASALGVSGQNNAIVVDAVNALRIVSAARSGRSALVLHVSIARQTQSPVKPSRLPLAFGQLSRERSFSRAVLHVFYFSKSQR